MLPQMIHRGWSMKHRDTRTVRYIGVGRGVPPNNNDKNAAGPPPRPYADVRVVIHQHTVQPNARQVFRPAAARPNPVADGPAAEQMPRVPSPTAPVQTVRIDPQIIDLSSDDEAKDQGVLTPPKPQPSSTSGNLQSNRRPLSQVTFVALVPLEDTPQGQPRKLNRPNPRRRREQLLKRQQQQDMANWGGRGARWN